jgi:YesN/AraC family two-component response regulator
LEQQKTRTFILDYPRNAYSQRDKTFFFVKNFFLKNNYVFISKHNRFADYPEHSHDFLEFNYMLSGDCTQIVNGQELLLKKGDILLLDQFCRHSIKELSTDDILINIIFPKEHFDVEWMTVITHQDNALFSFLIQNISRYSGKEYILFESSQNTAIQQIIEQMINHYFTDDHFSNEILRFYIPILFMELIGNTHYTINGKSINSESNQIVIDSLKVIEDEYETLSLQKLSKKLYYNKNYLSNLLHKKTGHTFTELLNSEKIKNAAFLLGSTSLPIRTVSENVGISNLNYFYKLFKEKYGENPGTYRLSQHLDK